MNLIPTSHLTHSTFVTIDINTLQEQPKEGRRKKKIPLSTVGAARQTIEETEKFQSERIRHWPNDSYCDGAERGRYKDHSQPHKKWCATEVEVNQRQIKNIKLHIVTDIKAV